MDKKLNNYFDFQYFLKFVSIIILLYCFDILVKGITNPENFYSPFIDHNLNYATGLRSTILYTSNIFAHSFGLNSHVDGKLIKIFDGAGVILGRPCLGLGIIIFWIAFIFAHRNNFAIKFQWCLIGVVIIWFINCLRISLLLLALQNKWKVNKYVDHHDLFKYFAYAAIV